MGDLARKSTKTKFRNLAENVPLAIRSRVQEFLDSIVFIQDPYLRDVRFLGVISGEGAPSASDLESDGLALYLGDAAYLCWKWKGTFYSQPFGESSDGSGSHSHDEYALADHTHAGLGAETLVDLDDTRIVDPVENDFIIYQRAKKRWENKRIAKIGELLSPTIDHGETIGLEDLDHPASAIIADTTNFDSILSPADDTVQKALDTLDDNFPEPVTVLVSPGPLVELGDDVVVTGLTPTVATHVDAIAELVFLSTGEIVMS